METDKRNDFDGCCGCCCYCCVAATTMAAAAESSTKVSMWMYSMLIDILICRWYMYVYARSHYERNNKLLGLVIHNNLFR